MFTKFKNFLAVFGGKAKKIFSKLGSDIKKASLKAWSYIKKLDLKILITLGAMLIIIIVLIIMLALHKSPAAETSGENSVIEFSTNYEGNLINVYSDEINLFPYGSLAFSNDGASKRSIELKDGYLEMSKPFGFGREFTFQTWIKVKDTSAVNPIIFGKASSDGDIHNGPLTVKFFNDYHTILCDMTFIDAKGEYISQSFATDNFIDTEALINIWHHVAVTFDKNGYTLYFDSKSVNNVPLPEGLTDFKEIADNGNPFFMGIGENGNIKALIDETRIYSYALSVEEIKAEYEQAHPVKTHRIVMKYDSDSATVNGEAKPLDGKVLKDKQDNSCLVPLKSVTEYIGGTFTADEKEKDKFDISYKNKNISLWLMDTNAVTDGNHTKLDFYPQEFDKIVYVPVIMFSKLFNLDVSFSDESIIIDF